MSLIAALRGVSRRRFRVALVASLALNVGAAAYMIAFLPFVPLQPFCMDRNAFSLFLLGPTVQIDGQMARPFLNAYRDTLNYWGINHVTYGRRIYVTLGDWLEYDYMMNMSYKAMTLLLEQRTGASVIDLRNQKVGLPEFDDAHETDWPPCGAVRKLTMEGGEWAYAGPKPDLEVKRRRFERLSESGRHARWRSAVRERGHAGNP